MATSPIAAYPKRLNGIIGQVFTEEFRPVPADGLSWRDDLLAPCIFHPDASTPWDENWTYREGVFNEKFVEVQVCKSLPGYSTGRKTGGN